MKAKIIISLLVLSWVLAGAVVYLHKERVQLVKLPPVSLAEWYKPQNKRHVWLHNMFKLRREMQAVDFYASAEQSAELADWTARLNEHYQKIAEMVPEWERRLDITAMDELLAAQQANRFDEIPSRLEELQKNCNSCHARYRAVTAMLYRAPDFSDIVVDSSHSLSESMAALNVQVNHIKIAIEAEDKARAVSVLGDLSSGIDDMGAMCQTCHEYLPKEYPDIAVSAAIDDLQVQLESGDIKQQGEALGLLAVTACAQCHGTHRVAYDARGLLNKKQGLIGLLRH